MVLLEGPAKFSKQAADASKFDAIEEQAMVRRRCSSIAEAIAAADGEQQRRIEQDDINQRVDGLYRRASICTAKRLEHEERLRRVSLDEWAENNGKLHRIKQVVVAKKLADQEQTRRVMEIETNVNINMMRRKASALMANRLESQEQARRMNEQAACVEQSRLSRVESIKKATELFEVARTEAIRERSLRTGQPMPEGDGTPANSKISRVLNFMKKSFSAVMRQMGFMV